MGLKEAQDTFKASIEAVRAKTNGALKDAIANTKTEALAKLGRLLAEQPAETLRQLAAEPHPTYLLEVIGACASVALLQQLISRAEEALHAGDIDEVKEVLKGLG